MQTIEEFEQAQQRQQELLEEMEEIEAAEELPLTSEDITVQPVSGEDSTITYEDGSQVTYEAGRIKRIVDAEGRTIYYSYEYDPNNTDLITGYILEEQNGPLFKYNANKELESITYLDGKTVTYTDGMIMSITDTGGIDKK